MKAVSTISERELFYIGLDHDEIEELINNNIFIRNDNNMLNVINQNKFEKILFKTVLKDREIFSDDDLDYIELSNINKKRLFSYGIARRIDDSKYKLVGNIDKLDSCRPEIDIMLYYDCYKDSMKSKNYKEAKEYFLEYINLSKVFDVKGKHYYELLKIDNFIDNEELNDIQKKEIRELNKHYYSCIAMKRYSDAERTALKYFELTNGNCSSYLLLGTVSLLQSRNGEALRYLKKAEEINPLNPFIYKELSYAYKTVRDYDNSIKASNKYNELDMYNHVYGYVNLFSIYIKLDKFNQALSIYQEAEEKFSDELLEKFYGKCRSICNAKKNEIQDEMDRQSLSPRTTTLFNERINFIDSIVDKSSILCIDEYNDIVLAQNQNKENDSIFLELLQPDSNNVVSLKRLDDYFKKLEVSDDEKNIMLLQASIVLQRENYNDKSSEYLKKVEKYPNKDTDLKERLNNTRKELVLIKKRKA